MDSILNLFSDLASDLEQLSNLYREYAHICLSDTAFQFEEDYQPLDESTDKDLQILKKQISEYTQKSINDVIRLLKALILEYKYSNKELAKINNYMLDLTENLYYINTKYNRMQDCQIGRPLQKMHSDLLANITLLHNKINEYNEKQINKEDQIYNIKVAKKHVIKEMRSRRDYLMEDIKACQAKLKKQGW